MIPLVAPQHPARLEGLIRVLSKTLPPTVTQELSPPGERSKEAGRSHMSLALAFAARALSALKASLAAVGLAALAVFFALPAQREALLGQYPLGAIAAWNDSF